jgi:hypothetical protein
MIANKRTCIAVALCALVPLAAPAQSEDIQIAVAEQFAEGLTDARWTTKLLGLQEKSAVDSALNYGKQAFFLVGGASSDWNPSVRHESTFLTVHGRKFGVVKAALTLELNAKQTKSTIAVTAVRVMGIQGKNLISVGCLRASDKPISVASGSCAAAIKKTFGVGLS